MADRLARSPSVRSTPRPSTTPTTGRSRSRLRRPNETPSSRRATRVQTPSPRRSTSDEAAATSGATSTRGTSPPGSVNQATSRSTGTASRMRHPLGSSSDAIAAATTGAPLRATDRRSATRSPSTTPTKRGSTCAPGLLTWVSRAAVRQASARSRTVRTSSAPSPRGGQACTCRGEVGSGSGGSPPDASGHTASPTSNNAATPATTARNRGDRGRSTTSCGGWGEARSSTATSTTTSSPQPELLAVRRDPWRCRPT